MQVDLSFFDTRLFVFFGDLINFKNASDMEASNAISAIRSSQTQSKWCPNEFGLFQVPRSDWLNDFDRKHSSTPINNAKWSRYLEYTLPMIHKTLRSAGCLCPLRSLKGMNRAKNEREAFKSRHIGEYWPLSSAMCPTTQESNPDAAYMHGRLTDRYFLL